MISNFTVKIGSDPEKNALIANHISEALKIALAKRDAQNVGRSDVGADENNIKDLIKFLQNFVAGFVEFASTPFGSALRGLIGGLSKGLSQDGLNGGVTDGIKGAANGLATGAIEGNDDFLNKALILSK